MSLKDKIWFAPKINKQFTKENTFEVYEKEDVDFHVFEVRKKIQRKMNIHERKLKKGIHSEISKDSCEAIVDTLETVLDWITEEFE